MSEIIANAITELRRLYAAADVDSYATEDEQGDAQVAQFKLIVASTCLLDELVFLATDPIFGGLIRDQFNAAAALVK